MTDVGRPRHRHSEFLASLELVAKADPRRQAHIVVDNDATHNHQRVQAWRRPASRVQLRFTPTDGSWRNLVEVFVSTIERHVVRRGDVANAKELVTQQ